MLSCLSNDNMHTIWVTANSSGDPDHKWHLVFGALLIEQRIMIIDMDTGMLDICFNDAAICWKRWNHWMTDVGYIPSCQLLIICATFFYIHYLPNQNWLWLAPFVFLSFFGIHICICIHKFVSLKLEVHWRRGMWLPLMAFCCISNWEHFVAFLIESILSHLLNRVNYIGSHCNIKLLHA